MRLRGTGVVAELTDTLSNTAVANVESLKFETKRPTYTFCAMITVPLEKKTQFTPSVELYDEKLLPDLTNFTHGPPPPPALVRASGRIQTVNEVGASIYDLIRQRFFGIGIQSFPNHRASL